MKRESATLADYRALLERIRGGTVPVEFALEIIDAAEREINVGDGEYTITRAVEISGRSRGWFRRRVDGWEKVGLARQLGGTWLVKDSVVPRRPRARLPGGGVDPALSDDEIFRLLNER